MTLFDCSHWCHQHWHRPNFIQGERRVAVKDRQLFPSCHRGNVAVGALYGITTIAWIWMLQKDDLGRVYPLMAMVFVLAPIASHLVFGERFHSP